jgi:hypothetical protein
MGDQVTNYFLVRVEFETVNETTGKPKKTVIRFTRMNGSIYWF